MQRPNSYHLATNRLSVPKAEIKKQRLDILHMFTAQTTKPLWRMVVKFVYVFLHNPYF